MEDPGSGGVRPGLTRVERAGVLGVALLVFSFAAGPVWRHAWNPDASILWSYAVIPALVLVVLGRRRALRPGTFLSETLVLSVFKFGITAMALIGFWSFSAPPAVVRAKRLSGAEEGRRGREISLKGDEGRAEARRGAAAPALIVELGGGRIAPGAIALASAAPVAFRSSDGRLHALQLLSGDGSVRANVPVLASGALRVLSFEEVSVAASLRCSVHPEETAAITR
jgi:hypothetical protein